MFVVGIQFVHFSCKLNLAAAVILYINFFCGLTMLRIHSL